MKTSATKKGCERKRRTSRARATAPLSSSLNTSMLKMAMVSCKELSPARSSACCA